MKSIRVTIWAGPPANRKREQGAQSSSTAWSVDLGNWQIYCLCKLGNTKGVT